MTGNKPLAGEAFRAAFGTARARRGAALRNRRGKRGRWAKAQPVVIVQPPRRKA